MLSVIIVNYNVKFFLEQCLHSVMKAVANIECEIFVVDNASTDGSREYLEPLFPEVKFRWRQTNDGFSKANNSVLNEARGRYILFLNPDTILPEDCFLKCMAFADSQKDFGALGCRMLDGSGRFLKESKRMIPTPQNSFFRFSGLSAIFPGSKLFAGYYAGHLPEKQNNEVDALAGAFMMVSKEALDKTKGFDEDYFMYGEDIDLSYRLQKMGLKNFYFADTTIIHFKGESTSRHSPEYRTRFYGAMKLFVQKHFKNTISTKLLFAAIDMVKAIQAIRKPSTEKSNKIPEFAVLSSQQRFDHIVNLLKYGSPTIMIKGRISPTGRDGFNSIASLSELGQCIQQKRFDHLVLAQGEMNYTDLINIAEKYSGKLTFLFHGFGSGCIVGSSDKNQKGIIFSPYN